MSLLKLYSRFLPGNNLCFKQVNYIMSSTVKENELITDFNNFAFSPLKLLDLPIEKNKDNYVRSCIKGVIFSCVKPTPLSGPKLVAFSEDALTNILDLDPIVTESKAFVDFVAGNNVLPSSTPLAHRYGGHQFGVWAMQLGDGRAILLGEYINRKGERWELQLKGSGKTPYSRLGDGRAVLRSSIREFLCSEAMFYLGIPTTRAGAVIVSEDKVIRDLLYDGHPQLEPAAVVLRLSPSWFRIGSLEILSKSNELDEMQKLVDFIIKEHFPDIVDDDTKILNFIQKVIRMSSDLVVQWQSVGFTHGVLNTDNMSLLGLTIDYGPFGFMEAYDPFYVPNHSDSESRYCYGNQVQVVLVNMLMLGKTVSPLLSSEHVVSLAQIVEKEFEYTKDKFMISESGINDNERMERMCKLNPCYVLRNWMAHQAISKAEQGDFSEVKFLLEVLKRPFTRQEEAENMGYSQKPPEWAKTLCLSCSS